MKCSLRALGAILCLGVQLSPVEARDERDAGAYAQCAAYFFLAANANPMGEYDANYRAGEYALNRAVRLDGEQRALDRLNSAAAALDQLIEKNMSKFERAEQRYDVICADIRRAATNPDPS